MEETLNEIMDSVAIHKKMVELRNMAREKFESGVAVTENNKLNNNPNRCDQHIIDLYSAYRIFRIMTILLEFGKSNEVGNDIDTIYRNLYNQV